jgi:hypothetical protein
MGNLIHVFSENLCFPESATGRDLPDRLVILGEEEDLDYDRADGGRRIECRFLQEVCKTLGLKDAEHDPVFVPLPFLGLHGGDNVHNQPVDTEADPSEEDRDDKTNE